MGRAFSPQNIWFLDPFLGRCPRLVWNRAFGAGIPCLCDTDGYKVQAMAPLLELP